MEHLDGCRKFRGGRLPCVPCPDSLVLKNAYHLFGKIRSEESVVMAHDNAASLDLLKIRHSHGLHDRGRGLFEHSYDGGGKHAHIVERVVSTHFAPPAR